MDKSITTTSKEDWERYIDEKDNWERVYIDKIREGCGVILVESSNPRSEKIVALLFKILKKISAAKLKGRICRVSVDKLIYQ